MTMTAAQTSNSQTSLKKEPWGIWAGILFVIATLVVAILTMGLPGLVLVMVPAALGMLALLCFIVFG